MYESDVCPAVRIQTRGSFCAELDNHTDDGFDSWTADVNPRLALSNTGKWDKIQRQQLTTPFWTLQSDELGSTFS
jgi:hypothetical protein